MCDPLAVGLRRPYEGEKAGGQHDVRVDTPMRLLTFNLHLLSLDWPVPILTCEDGCLHMTEEGEILSIADCASVSAFATGK